MLCSQVGPFREFPPLLSFRASQRGSMDQQLSHISSHQHAGQNYSQFRSAFVINRLIKGEIPTPIQLGLKRELRYISAVMSDVGIGLCALEDLFLFLLNLIDHDSLYTPSVLCNLLRIFFCGRSLRSEIPWKGSVLVQRKGIQQYWPEEEVKLQCIHTKASVSWCVSSAGNGVCWCALKRVLYPDLCTHVSVVRCGSWKWCDLGMAMCLQRKSPS